MRVSTSLLRFGVFLVSASMSFPVQAESSGGVSLRQTTPLFSAIGELGGYVGQRIRANTDGYLKTFDIEHYAGMVEEKHHRDWWWIGEQPGKWLESAVLASEQADDTALTERARRILGRLVAAQEPGGYLGITDPAVRNKEQPLRGMDAYELHFMLHGLLTAAEAWKDAEALETARRLGDYFVANIGPDKAEFWPSPLRPPENLNTIICGQYVWVPENTRKAAQLYDHSAIAGHTAHYGWEGSLLIDPMLRLHQATGDPRFLEWSQWVVSRLDTWGGWNAFSRLDDVAARKIGVHQLQPYVHSHTFQMNFLGFLRLYEITGDASLLRKVRAAWKDIAERQLYITGGVSVGEHYEPGYRRPLTGPVVETCANMSWMELTQYLLELTGEPLYGDAIERLLFNHVFAAQTIDGDSYRYHTPPNGFKPDDYFHGPDCCTGSGHRIVAKLPLFCYAETTEGICVNQYVPSRARLRLPGGGLVNVRLETNYPEEEEVRLRLEPDAKTRFTLQLRLPAWCDKPQVMINGVKVRSVTPGTYAVIGREWQRGDTVKLVFPMEPHWITHEHWEETGPPRRALVRGPVVYALDTVWWDNGTAPASFDAGRDAVLLEETPKLRRLEARWGALGPFYEIGVGLPDRVKTKAPLVPFTNIGRWYRPDAPKPERGSKAYSYAVWLRPAAR